MKLRKTTGMYCQGRVSLKKTNLFSNTFCKWFKLLSYLLIRLFLFRMDQDTFMTNNNIDIGRSENISKLKTTIDLKDKWYTGPKKQKKGNNTTSGIYQKPFHVRIFKYLSL